MLFILVYWTKINGMRRCCKKCVHHIGADKLPSVIRGANKSRGQSAFYNTHSQSTRPEGSDPVPKESESGSAAHQSTHSTHAPAAHRPPLHCHGASARISRDPDFSAVGAHRPTWAAGRRQRTRPTLHGPVSQSEQTLHNLTFLLLPFEFSKLFLIYHVCVAIF